MVRSSSGLGRLSFQGADIRFESNTHYKFIKYANIQI